MTTRREFLGTCAAAAFLPPGPPSRVVIARERPPRVDPARLLKLLDRAMQAFFNRDSPLEAWKVVVRPNEVVGLKVNCLAGRGTASTSPMLVDAVIERLRQAGVPPGNIIIWDRLNSDLESAGFRIATASGRVRCFGNDTAGYGDELAMSGAAASLVSRTLTHACDAVVSLPVLKDHGIAGVTMALKNFFGAVHNPNKYHVNAGDPYVADVFALPAVRGKVRLTICEAVAPQYEGGPSYMPQWSWPFNGLLVARDPVALDHTGWQIIERKRAELGLKSLAQENRAPKYIATAADAEHRLGVNDPRRIEKVEV